VVHESPETRGAWASHGVQGFYCEPAMNHYRNYKCYIPETNGMRLGKTVEFFPKHVQMPQTSSEDRLSAAIENITNILQNLHPATPSLKEGTPNNDAISKLQKIFGSNTTPPQTKTTMNYNFPRVLKNNNSPRVLSRNNDSPRVVERMERIIEQDEETEFPMGTVIKKKFGKHIHTGKITRYDPKEELYWIEYEDGDHEEMTYRQVQIYKRTDKPDRPRNRFTRTALTKLATRKRGRPNKKSALIKLATRKRGRPSKKSALANVTTKIQQPEKDEDKKYKQKEMPTIPLGFAYAVYDEASGRMM
jgi:hypothetical protein